MHKALFGMEKLTGAVIRSCSVDKVPRESLQNSQKNTSAGVIFKSDSGKVTLVFSCKLRSF